MYHITKLLPMEIMDKETFQSYTYIWYAYKTSVTANEIINRTGDRIVHTRKMIKSLIKDC